MYEERCQLNFGGGGANFDNIFFGNHYDNNDNVQDDFKENAVSNA